MELVYFITYKDGPIKIGKAINPLNRMKSLQTSLPHKLELLGVQEGGYALESTLHHKFSEIRKHGEWFEDLPLLREYISLHAKPYDHEKREKREKLRAPNKMVKRAFLRDRAADRRASLENQIVEIVAEAMDYWVNAAREFDLALNEIEDHITAKHGGFCNFKPLRLKIRRIVDKAIQTNNWMNGRDLLYYESDVTDKIIERHAADFVRKRINAFLSDKEIAG